MARKFKLDAEVVFRVCCRIGVTFPEKSCYEGMILKQTATGSAIEYTDLQK